MGGGGGVNLQPPTFTSPMLELTIVVVPLSSGKHTVV
jgi:hypothetical protein